MNNIRTWVTGETIAKDHLVNLGYQILELNYKTQFGEVDIIALDPKERQIEFYNNQLKIGKIDNFLYNNLISQCEDTIVFVEVKARENHRVWNPFSAITPQKQLLITKSAMVYLEENNKTEFKARFDCIGISGDKLEHIENAFYANL